MNTISRYWWIGELIYDEDNIKNPYYLIEVFRGDLQQMFIPCCLAILLATLIY